MSHILGSNKAEGIVVKPIKNITWMTKRQFEERVIIKIKLPEFDELRQKSNKCNQNAGKVSFYLLLFFR